MNRDLLVLTTGGTIDRTAYPSPTGDYEGLDRIGCWLNTMRARGELDPDLGTLRVEPICEKFSTDLGDMEMGKIADAIGAAPESRVIITMGTTDMPAQARLLKSLLAERGITDKAVVLTGALVPMVHGLKQSDGYQNLVHAVEVAVHNARPGVVIAMHGQVLDPKRAIKSEDPPALYEGTHTISEGKRGSLLG